MKNEATNEATNEAKNEVLKTSDRIRGHTRGVAKRGTTLPAAAKLRKQCRRVRGDTPECHEAAVVLSQAMKARCSAASSGAKSSSTFAGESAGYAEAIRIIWASCPRRS